MSLGIDFAEALTKDAQREPSGGWDLSAPESNLRHVLLAEVDGYSKMTVEEQTRSLEELQAVIGRASEFQQALAADRLIANGDRRNGVGFLWDGPARCNQVRG